MTFSHRCAGVPISSKLGPEIMLIRCTATYNTAGVFDSATARILDGAGSAQKKEFYSRREKSSES
jgi:hypothetical protein